MTNTSMNIRMDSKVKQQAQHLFPSGAQRGGDGGVLQRPVSAACPALPGSAHAARQQPRQPFFP